MTTAHTWATHGRRFAAALALGSACGTALAFTLGEVQVRSALGEPVDARIPVTAAPGEALSGACFSMTPSAPAGIPGLPGGTLELRRHREGAELRVKTRAGVDDPAVAFAISAGCPGASGAMQKREYTVLLAPRVTPPQPGASRAGNAHANAAAAAPAPAPETIARLPVRPGDTLARLARDIFPGNAAVRADYLEALRAANPALASLDADAPLPSDAVVALPDLRTFERHGRRREAVAPRSPRPRSEDQEARETSRAAAPSPARHRKAPAVVAPLVARAPSHALRGEAPRLRVGVPSAEFQLKLSGPVMDLSPSRAVTPKQRDELRQRLLVLDADDRMAELLALRENIRQLETQISELKLKLAQPPAPAVPAASPAKAPVVAMAPAAPNAEAAPAKAPVVAMAPAEPAAPKAGAAPAKAPAAETNPPRAEPKAPTPETKPAVAPAAPRAEDKAQAPPNTAAPVTPKGPRVVPAPARGEPWYRSTWVLGGLLVLVLLALAFLILRRRAAAYATEDEVAPEDETGMAEEEPSTEFLVAEELPVRAQSSVASDEPVAADPEEWAATTRIPAEDNADLRRRYVEERFPEIVSGALVMENPASVVKSARLFYDDGAVPRAVELLQLAIEQDPSQLAPWLALFEVFRRERLPGEFATLANRFQPRPESRSCWAKVCAAGREIDSGNPLYGAGVEPFDAVADNWLGDAAQLPGDALAAELRGGLMQGAALTDRDLVADPTPALRKAESFDVA